MGYPYAIRKLRSRKSCFITLTYDNENLPPDGSLQIEDYQKFLKRLRKKNKFRYFLVGEYGDLNWRPHYHAILYGLGEVDQAVIQESWNMGNTETFPCDDKLIRYICGYCLKKMTNKNDDRLQYGEHPEFSRMSTKPALGTNIILPLAQSLRTKHGQRYIDENGDVPFEFK